MSGDGLKPFVLWGQNKESVFLRVNLSEVEVKPTIDFKVKSVTFKCRGKGITGVNDYAFSLDLLHPIDSKKCTYHHMATAIELVLAKKGVGVKWERVQEKAAKLHWLKIDFDRFAFDTSDESEDERDKMESFKNLYDPSQDMYEKATMRSDNESLNVLKICYLLIFNLFQLIGYSSILIMCLYHFYLRRNETPEPPQSLQPQPPNAFTTLGPKMMVCQGLAVMEILHAVLKWVKSSPLPSVLQVIGRAIIVFIILLPEEKLHGKEVVYYLFATWSAVEVVRYPYYMLSTLGKEVGVVTWLRYTIWIPLYPLGFFFEGVVMILALPLYESSGRFNLLLPNPLNFHFRFVTCLTAYMFCFLPGMYVLMNRMYLQRKKKLGGGGGGGKRKKIE